MVGISFHFLDVEPALLITAIWTSSMISIAATGIPARITLEAAAAASRIVGNVTTATLVSSGITANFSVISVTIPKVPSEPTNRFVKLYPAADLLIRVSTSANQCPSTLPRPSPSFNNGTVGENDSEINNPVFHGPIPNSVCATNPISIISIFLVCCCTCSWFPPYHRFAPGHGVSMRSILLRLYWCAY